MKTRNLLSLLRPKHWVKNLIVFLPGFFAGSADALLQVELWLLFAAFCIAASAVYVFNDLMDVEQDKRHPEKCKRALASGAVSKVQAVVFALVLLTLLAVMLWFLPQSWGYIVAYLTLNILYTLWFKAVAIVDVACISLGFILRIFAGGAESGIEVSHWMAIIVFLAATSIAFAKRRDDFTSVEPDHILGLRKSLGQYSVGFLDVALSINLAVTFVAYIIYTTDIEVIERIGSPYLYITGFFVFLGVMRFLQITIIENNSGSPVKVFFTDRFLQITVLLWLATFSIILYGGSY